MPLDVAWCDDAFVREHGLVVTEKEDPFPLVVPDEPNGHLFDTSRAVAAGLTFRPLAETVADTLAWDRDRGVEELTAGLSVRPGRRAAGRARRGLLTLGPTERSHLSARLR